MCVWGDRLSACSCVHAGFREFDHNTFQKNQTKEERSASINKSDVYCKALIEFYRLSNSVNSVLRANIVESLVLHYNSTVDANRNTVTLCYVYDFYTRLFLKRKNDFEVVEANGWMMF